MEVTETSADGLKREFRIVIGARDLDERLEARIETLKNQVQMKGFRPGKVPASHLKKAYGKSLMGEIVQEAVSQSTQKAIEERALRPALQPDIQFENALEKVVDEGADLAFKVVVELLPEIKLANFKDIKLERLSAPVSDADVEAATQDLARQARSFEQKGDGALAAEGDALTIDFLGKIDGVAFDGGKGEDVRLEIGARQFIPGFEEQLVGAKAGEARVIAVKFPANYPVDRLKDKDATFDVTVHEIRAPVIPPADEAFAQRFGLDSVDKLKDALRQRIANEHKMLSRRLLKKGLLDVLDEQHNFELPGGMVKAEFDQIWREVQHSFEHGHPAPEDVGKSEDVLKADYGKIAERRVRLGLVLAEVGRLNQITVGQDEVSRAIGEEARRYPGQEKQVFEFYRQNPQAQAQIRAPLFEDKVVDFILELA